MKTTRGNEIEARLSEFRKATAGRSAEEVLAYVAGRFGGGVAFASSFGAEDQVLTDMLCKVARGVKLFTLDTGRLPQETYDVLEATRRRYGIDINVYFPDWRQVEKMVNGRGVNLFYHSIEERRMCCKVRKIEPLKRALAGLDGWICGLRQGQSTTRAGLEVVDWDEAFGVWKICPLAQWSTEQVWDYINENNVPYNRLHDAGYPSIGCAPCTRAVIEGQDIRAGRWWWEEPEHKECGLHLQSDAKETGKAGR